ncbi:hypothetical protein SAMN05660845_2392 [Flavobacterium swingsii]|uniref:Uncharacterized protein n=1 Tax=Flavobacterium swingsii TaxID=498292 RepID=A0A1I0ZRQ7_9FLAO|nr:hypothetical protein [Flavobacterium swingsii]SFB28414.1 hypothetical protein SAMN05660845_2392 [Flavobacterium swingsii]
MKNKLIFAFILFLVTEYILRTFVKQFKYHEVGYLVELLSLIIASFVTSFFSRKIIDTQNFRSIYLKLSFASIFGFLVAKTILFFQWYWIIAPEYRNVNGDMEEGFAWTLLDSMIGVLEIIISFLFSVVIIKGIRKQK